MLVEQKGGLRQATVSSLGSEGDSSALEVQIRLVGGIGISVINAVPEELVFISLEQIEVLFLEPSSTSQRSRWVAKHLLKKFRNFAWKSNETIEINGRPLEVVTFSRWERKVGKFCSF